MRFPPKWGCSFDRFGGKVCAFVWLCESERFEENRKVDLINFYDPFFKSAHFFSKGKGRM